LAHGSAEGDAVAVAGAMLGAMADGDGLAAVEQPAPIRASVTAVAIADARRLSLIEPSSLGTRRV
jgi:hypothetical protein